MSFARFAPAALLAVAAVPALAQDLAYEVVNNSSSTLVGFYTSPASDPNWSPNLVTGPNALASGETGTVTLTDGSTECVYDLRFVFEDTSELVDQVDVCDMASYTLSDAE